MFKIRSLDGLLLKSNAYVQYYGIEGCTWCLFVTSIATCKAVINARKSLTKRVVTNHYALIQFLGNK